MPWRQPARLCTGLGLAALTIVAALPACSSSPIVGPTPQGPAEPADGLLRGVLQHGHTSLTVDMAWSPDSRYLATRGHKMTKIWRADSGALIRNVGGHEGSQVELWWTKQGGLVSQGETTYIWDVETGRRTPTATLPRAHRPYRQLSLPAPTDGPNGRLLRLDDGAVSVLDRHSGKKLFDNPDQDVLDACWSSDGKYIAAGRIDGTVKVRDATDGAVVFTSTDHGAGVGVVSWSPDGSTIASGSYDVYLWDAPRGPQRTKLGAKANEIRAIAWHPTRAWVLTSSDDGGLRIWDGESGSIVHMVDIDNVAVSAAWSPDGRFVALVPSGDYPEIRDENLALVHTLEVHHDSVNQIAWNRDGSLVATASQDATVGIWNPTTGKLVRQLDSSTYTRSVSWSPDGTQLAVGTTDYDLQIFNPHSGLRSIRVARHQHTSSASQSRRVLWSPDGRFIVVLGGFDDDGSTTVEVWQVEPPKLLHELHDDGQRVETLAFSRDGSVLATAGCDEKIRLWRLDPPELMDTRTGHVGCVEALDFGVSGALASGGVDGKLLIWPDAAAGIPRPPVALLAGTVESGAWLTVANGRYDSPENTDDTLRLAVGDQIGKPADWTSLRDPAVVAAALQGRRK